MVKIRLERIDIQEGVIVEVLLDSGAMGLVMSEEFAKKQDFKLKKLERLINVRNVNGSLNKEELIEHTVEVNIYYQRYKEKMEISVGEVRLGETERRRSKRESRKKAERKRKEKKTEKRKNYRG